MLCTFLTLFPFLTHLDIEIVVCAKSHCCVLVSLATLHILHTTTYPIFRLSTFSHTPQTLMSEVQARPSTSRGRGSAIRAGRGGMSSRGGSRLGARQSNGEAPISEPSVTLEDQGELGQLKKHYKSQLDTLKELFPDWTDDDLVFALQETDGDLQNTIERITEGIKATQKKPA